MKSKRNVWLTIIIILIAAILIIFINQDMKTEVSPKTSQSPGIINITPSQVTTAPKRILSPTPAPPVNLKEPPKFANIYTDIYQTDQGKIYVTGNNGVLLFYDGKEYKPVDTKTRKDLYAVCGTGKNIYIAGREGYFSHFDGEKMETNKPVIRRKNSSFTCL